MEPTGQFGYARAMYRDEVLAKIRQDQAALRAIGVNSISLFGSVARGEERNESDIDVAVQLDTASLPSGFAYFGRIADLSERLSVVLGRNVDVVPEPTRRPDLQRSIDRDRCVVF